MSNIATQAIVDGTAAPGLAAGSTTNNYQDRRGSLKVTNTLPTEADLARLGAGFYTTSVISGYTPTQAVPTTAAMLSIYNSNGSGGKSLIIARAGALVYTGGAVGQQSFSLLARNDVPGQNTAITTTNIVSRLDGVAYSGGVVSKSLVTLAAISASNNTAWIPVGPGINLSGSASTGSFYGTTLWAECYGMWIVRPGGMFSLAVSGGISSGTISFTGAVFGYEVQLDLP